jgi:hypothetical protein
VAVRFFNLQFSIFNSASPQFATLRAQLPGGGATDMKTWEYKIINVRSENYSMDPRRAEELNRLGDEGWELVSITSINFKTGATDHIGMVFKREKAAPA